MATSRAEAARLRRLTDAELLAELGPIAAWLAQYQPTLDRRRAIWVEGRRRGITQAALGAASGVSYVAVAAATNPRTPKE